MSVRDEVQREKEAGQELEIDMLLYQKKKFWTWPLAKRIFF